MTGQPETEAWEPREELYLHSHFSEPLNGLESDGLDGMGKETLRMVRILMKGGDHLKLTAAQHEALLASVRGTKLKRPSKDVAE